MRGITSASLAALALLCLMVAAGVAWIAGQLQETSSALVRDAESLRLVTLIELHLLDYQRLAVFLDDPVAVAERQEVRRRLIAALDEAGRYSAADGEVELVERARGDITAYVERRRLLEQRGLGPLDIQRQVRPLLSRALSDLDELYEVNRREVAGAYARAQQVGAVFIAAAVLTAVLAAILLLIAALAIRHMLLRPILGLRETIDRFRSGEPAAQADEQAPRELSDIARAFNEMSAELGRQKARQLAFIAGVAHDLRNPLTALQFGVDALKAQDTRMDAGAHDTLTLLGRQLNHLERMVDDLMQTSTIEAGELVLEPSVFDLREAVDAVVSLYRPTVPTRRIDVQLQGEPAFVRADRMRIEQVVGNLLNNAIKYSPPESPIEIEVEQSDGRARLAVVDHGVGIRAEEIEDIFRPFWRGTATAERSGTGLGLSVARKIVSAHGGSISVQSVPGAGSVFRLDIPIADAADLRRQAI
ncbi:MAG: HAMP domain-containing histidine kinase [Gammaproteobacteria bacterium]|nr:HAMP domain-containing histidine kinase [Gammaproteobacteria bacterium]